MTAVAAVLSLLIRRDWTTGVLATALALISVTSLLIVWRLEWALQRADEAVAQSERWADAGPALAEAAAALARAVTGLTSANSAAGQTFVLHCETACQQLAHAFSSGTGHKCRVTLQECFVPEEGPLDRVAVKVVARSYPPPGHVDGVDFVEDNTDFSDLMKGARSYFCNDLPAALTTGYRNSHWTPERLASWRLSGEYPYRSTVVWPIRGMLGDGTDRASWDIRGFLSVDWQEADTFDANTIVPMGETATHAAYTGLVLYRTWDEEELWRD